MSETSEKKVPIWRPNTILGIRKEEGGGLNQIFEGVMDCGDNFATLQSEYFMLKRIRIAVGLLLGYNKDYNNHFLSNSDIDRFPNGIHASLF